MAYVTTYDAQDLAAWSGIPSFMGRWFSVNGVDVQYVGPLAERFKLYFRAKQLGYRALRNERHFREREPRVLQDFARQVDRRLAEDPADLVLSPGTIAIARLGGDYPVVYWTDATFGNLIDFYPEFSGLSRRTIADGHAMERAAVARADLCIYSSEWAAQSAITTYGARQARVKVIPYGANVDIVPSSRESVDIVRRRSLTSCELLFVGIHWQRKGGSFAVDVARELDHLGVPTQLTLVGAQPERPESLPSYVRTAGYIDKASSVGRTMLDDLFRKAHFLVLPSIAECTPIAFSEANAFAVPCIAKDVGGVGGVISHGRNGFLLPPSAEPRTWAETIAQTLANPYGYRSLALSSRQEYDERLNWRSATHRVIELSSSLLRAHDTAEDAR